MLSSLKKNMLRRKDLKGYWRIVDTVPVCHFLKPGPPPKKKNQLKQCCLVLNGMFMHFKRNQ